MQFSSVCFTTSVGPKMLRALRISSFLKFLAIVPEKNQIFLGVIFQSVDGSMLAESLSRRRLTWVRTDLCLFLSSARQNCLFGLFKYTAQKRASKVGLLSGHQYTTCAPALFGTVPKLNFKVILTVSVVALRYKKYNSELIEMHFLLHLYVYINKKMIFFIAVEKSLIRLFSGGLK